MKRCSLLMLSIFLLSSTNELFSMQAYHDARDAAGRGAQHVRDAYAAAGRGVQYVQPYARGARDGVVQFAEAVRDRRVYQDYYPQDGLLGVAGQGVAAGGKRVVNGVVKPVSSVAWNNKKASGAGLLAVLSGIIVKYAVTPSETFWGNWERWHKGMTYRVKYYKSYAWAPITAVAAALVASSRGHHRGRADVIGMAAGTVAGLFQLAWNRLSVRSVNNNYIVYQKKGDSLSRGQIELKETQLARYRQKEDDFKDGLYWRDKESLLIDKESVINTLKLDVYAGRLVIIDPRTGNKVEYPTPLQVLAAVDKEMESLYEDIRTLKSMHLERNAEKLKNFKPRTSLTSIMWPNLNYTLETAKDLAEMRERLKGLQEILSNFRAGIGTHCEKSPMCDPWTGKISYIGATQSFGEPRYGNAENNGVPANN